MTRPVGGRGRQTAKDIRGAPLLLGTLAMFAVLDVISKALVVDYGVVQLLWARYVFFVALLAVMWKPNRWRPVLRTRHLQLQIWRGLMPVGVGASLVLGLQHLPLAETTAILYVAPVVVVALSVVWLGERATTTIIGALVLGFAGVLVVTRPGSGLFGWPAIYPIAGAVFLALYHVMTRRVRGDGTETSLAYTALVGTVVTSVAVVFTWTPPTPHVWILFVLAGLLHGGGQFLLIKAFTLSEASTLAPFNYAQIPMAVALGVVTFGDLPDGLSFAGMAMIAGAGLWVWHAGRATPAPA